MQVKGWKLPPRATSEMNVKFRTAGEEQEEDDKRVNPISLSKDRLLSVEVIERRYLKVPLGQSKGDLVQNVLSGSCSSNEPPKTLLTWREVVKRCETAAKCRCASASWKRLWLGTSRSLKVSCQFYHSGDKKDQLLLCELQGLPHVLLPPADGQHPRRRLVLLRMSQQSHRPAQLQRVSESTVATSAPSPPLS